MKKSVLIGVLILGIISFFFDKEIVELVVGLRVNWLNPMLFGISSLAWIVVLVGLLIGLFLVVKKKRLGFDLLGSLLVSVGIVYSLKFIINRMRPVGHQIYTNLMDGSFPSAHAAVVFCLLPLFWKTKFRMYWLVFAFLVAFSRIYLGVHYLSDVVFGGLIGFLIGWLILKKKISYFSE